MGKAFVAVAWDDSNASMAGNGVGTVPMAEVFEVEAHNTKEAEQIARRKAERNLHASSIKTSFLRWGD